MTKHNIVSKAKRSEIQERKRSQHPNGKLKQKKDNNIPISGKRKRKLLNKWRKDQKEALQSGLISMEDVEMVVAEGTSNDSSSKAQLKFPMKKGGKLKIKKLKGKRKSKKGQRNPSAKVASVEAMQE